MDAITTRIEFAEVTQHCDVELDEHVGYHWGETRVNEQDLITEVWRGCQCRGKFFWVPLQAARTAGFTG